LATLDCTTLSADLFESEVFGHERGAFTGSHGERKGLVEQAEGGSLFLDEIGEMPLPLQAKLLRVLENGEFRRVGGGVMRRPDVRIVCGIM
jgi:two-component system response regulator AtoC